MIFYYGLFLGILVYNFQQLEALNRTELVNFVALTSDVRKFYKSSSVLIVYDYQPANSWEFKEAVLTIIREFSNRNIMSQVISYATLDFTINFEMNVRLAQPANPLFMLYIHNSDNLDFFRKVTTGRDISFFTWFVFIDNEAKLDCEYPQGNPFNLEMDTRMIVKCEGSLKIKKYFSIFKNTTEVVDLAIWTPGEQLVLTDDDNLLQVKKDMKGITLRIARHKYLANEPNNAIANYLESLVNTLANISNFKTKVVLEVDQYGYRNATTNQWVGLMKSMDEKEADIAELLFSMSADRMQVIDYTMPLMRAQTRFYVKLPDTVKIRWSAYFQVFNRNVWAAIGIFLLLLSIVLTFMKNEHGRFVNVHSFFGNFIDVLGIYCQQGLPELPVNTPLKMLYFSILILSLILYAVYSATITSYIAVLTAGLPFSTYDEFLHNKAYKLVILRGSRDELLIHSNDWLLGPLENKMKKHDELPSNAYEAFQQACEENVALYANEVMFDSISEDVQCALGWLETSRIENQAMGLTKNSPYTETINYYILRLLNHGILSRMKSAYFYKLIQLPENKPNVISISEITPILAIWLIGVATSWIIFYIEILFFKKSLYKSKKPSHINIRHYTWRRYHLFLYKIYQLNLDTR
ncbi:glutamate receptor 2-like isoform X2 [Nasonia vitripennis]|uniref:Ionotropic glutamate receptor L-glutamate and glycine-binding domain-containing protein n=1 Tax=Nasonia vitripennis TaxID=7425 RepID=A0A7M7INS3_NASVI|nr:glutamate receptor 2-like isoform X2 [Nasonia vitripennis]